MPRRDRPAKHTTTPHEGSDSETASPTAATSPSSASPPTPAPEKPTQLFTEPPTRANKRSNWLLLGLCLLLALPAPLIEISRPDVLDPGEALTLATSTQSWQYHANLSPANQLKIENLIPRFNTRPQLSRPPGSTWLHTAAFSLPAQAPLTTKDLILRARLVSVAMALLAIACVYWAALSIGGVTTAFFAALVCASNPLWIYYARTASDSILHTAWVLMSIASALWAIRPLKPAPAVLRQALGWGLCGLSLGAAMLTVGPIAVTEVCIPLLLVMILSRERISHTMGLIAALFIGVQLTLPWAAYVHSQIPDISQQWLLQLLPTGQLTSGGGVVPFLGSTTAWCLIAASPWTLWLIAAVVQPFSVSSTGQRRCLFLGWIWFAWTAAIVVMNLPSGPGNLILILPPLAVFTGQLFDHYTNMAAEGRHARFWRLLRWPHLAFLTIGSVALPIILYTQPTLVTQGLLAQPLSTYISMPASLGIGLILIATTGLSLRWALKQYPDRVLICWAMWTLMAAWMLAAPVARGPSAMSPIRHEGQYLTRLAENQPVYWLSESSSTPGLTPEPTVEPDPSLTLYLSRPVPTISSNEIVTAVRNHGSIILLSARTPIETTMDLTVNLVASLRHSRLFVWQIKPHTTQDCAASLR